MATVIIPLEELISTLQSKLPEQIRELSVSGDDIKFKLHQSTKVFLPDIDLPVTIRFIAFRENSVYLKLVFDTNTVVNQFINIIMKMFSKVLTKFDDKIDLDGQNIRIPNINKYIPSNNMQVNDLEIIDGDVIIQVQLI